MPVLCHAVLTCNDRAQVEEKGAVSQDLELYISKDHQEDGFTLIARSEVRIRPVHWGQYSWTV